MKAGIYIEKDNILLKADHTTIDKMKGCDFLCALDRDEIQNINHVVIDFANLKYVSPEEYLLLRQVINSFRLMGLEVKFKNITALLSLSLVNCEGSGFFRQN